LGIVEELRLARWFAAARYGALGTAEALGRTISFMKSFQSAASVLQKTGAVSFWLAA
jgi:hypothetical protein